MDSFFPTILQVTDEAQGIWIFSQRLVSSTAISGLSWMEPWSDLMAAQDDSITGRLDHCSTPDAVRWCPAALLFDKSLNNFLLFYCSITSRSCSYFQQEFIVFFFTPAQLHTSLYPTWTTLNAFQIYSKNHPQYQWCFVRSNHWFDGGNYTGPLQCTINKSQFHHGPMSETHLACSLQHAPPRQGAPTARCLPILCTVFWMQRSFPFRDQISTSTLKTERKQPDRKCLFLV